MRTRIVLAFWFASVICGFASDKPLPVSAAQLLSAPRTFNGKRVFVLGYLAPPDPHTPLLYPSEAAARRTHNARDGIVVFVLPPKISPPQIQRLEHGYIRVVGTFRHIHLWRKERPSPRGGIERSVVTANSGYGWDGLHENALEDITELKSVARP